MEKTETTNVDPKLQAAIDKYAIYGIEDPYPEIEPTLLNSADIYDYVEKTGMIYPFNQNYLKPASYGVPLGGEFVYWENMDKIVEGRFENIVERDSENERVFVLKKNSIVYLGLAPEFRFPSYIAARFNLKIKHIYQGLLLGTGPLIDPGFQGRIYVPLHNLTNNEYKIQIDKPLIWMEFTKLSSNISWNKNYQANKERVGEYVPFDPEKIKQKNKLKDYLKDANHGPVLSTIQAIQNDIDTGLKKSEDLQKKADSATASFNRAVIIAIFSIFITISATIFQTYNIHLKTIDYLKDYDKKIQDEHTKFIKEESANLEAKKDIIKLEERIKKLEK